MAIIRNRITRSGSALSPEPPAGTQIAASREVTNTAARLLLTTAQAYNKTVVELDTGKAYELIQGGDPAVSGDWLQIGDRDETGATIRTKLAIPAYANLAAANAGEAEIGVPYWDTALSRLKTTTDIA